MDKELILRQIIRDIINEMVKDIIINTKKNLKKNKIKSINDVYDSQLLLVNFSNKMKLFDNSIKQFLKKNMYYSKDVIKKTNQGKKIIKYLFNSINDDRKKFIKFSKHNQYKERSVCDFIAGMTDRYAINLYNDIK